MKTRLLYGLRCDLTGFFSSDDIVGTWDIAVAGLSTLLLSGEWRFGFHEQTRSIRWLAAVVSMVQLSYSDPQLSVLPKVTGGRHLVFWISLPNDPQVMVPISEY